MSPVIKQLLALLLAAGFCCAGEIRLGDTGNPAANGDNLNSAFAAATCGDTIILQAGVHYARAFEVAVPPKSCDGWITVQSSAIENLPEGRRVEDIDEQYMPHVRTTNPSGPTFRIKNLAKQWRFIGLLLTNSTNTDAGCENGGVCSHTNDIVAQDDLTSNSYGQHPSHITFDRCIIRPHTPNPLFVSASHGITLNGAYITISNSRIFGFHGWGSVDGDVGITPVYYPIVAVTSSTNPVFTDSIPTPMAAGTKRGVEVRGFTGEWAILNGFRSIKVASSTTINEPEMTITVITVPSGTGTRVADVVTSAPHNLRNGSRVTLKTNPNISNLNGMYSVTKVTDSWFTIEVPGNVPAGSYQSYWGYANTAQIDTSSLPQPPTGSGSWRICSRITGYSFLSVSGPGPITIHNNFLSSAFTPIFLGGGGQFRKYFATLTNPTPTSATFSNVTDLEVGDVIAVRAGGGFRTARVTGISGNEVTFVSQGPGFALGTSTPDSPGEARWRGYNITGVRITNNTLYRPLELGYSGSKGFAEIKTGVDMLIEGNRLEGNDSVSQVFFTNRNQGVASPWNMIQDVMFRNNLLLGPVATAWQIRDDEQATYYAVNGKGPDGRKAVLRYENNLHAQVSAPIFSLIDRSEATFRHNTWNAPGLMLSSGYPSPLPIEIMRSIDCGGPPAGPRPLLFHDNIGPWGANGFAEIGTNCWDLNRAGNIFIDDKDKNPQVPGNAVVDLPSDIFAQPCTLQNWENCFLRPDSPLKNSATDGKDPGVDRAALEQAISNWLEDAHVHTTPGSTQAVLTFTLHSLVSDCKLQIFIDPARQSIHGDTDSSGNQLCERASSAIDGQTVQFVAGATHPLAHSTRYYFRLIDGTRTIIGDFLTGPPEPQESEFVVDWPIERGGEYSASANMSNPVQIPSGVRHVVPVPAGQVRYYRGNGDSVRVLVAP